MPSSPRTMAFDRIELMETFLVIVEAGSLTAAARQLKTTQPTISRRLQLFEQYLGLSLVKRTTHSLSLTPDGERCVERCRYLLENWYAVESDLRQAREEPQGMLRVLAPHAFGQDRLIGPISDYLARYNKVSVEWNLHDDRSFHDFIGEGIDCAIQVGEITAPDMVAVPLGKIDRIIVASPALLAEYGDVTQIATLNQLPWVALTTFYQTQLQLTHESGQESALIRFQPRFRTDNLYALKNAILKGIGIGVGSAWVLQEELASGHLIQLMPAWQAAPLPVHLVYPYARYYPARLRCFIDAMKKVLPGIFRTIRQDTPLPTSE